MGVRLSPFLSESGEEGGLIAENVLWIGCAEFLDGNVASLDQLTICCTIANMALIYLRVRLLNA